MVSLSQDELMSAPIRPRALNFLALSDDLTGATALASELHGAGWRALASPWTGSRPEVPGIEALVLDTGSRSLSTAAAGERIERAVGSFDSAPHGWYKRIDSGLRGNVRAEVETFSACLGRPIVVAAAAPSLGISTVEGVQLFDGTPINNTHFGDGAEAAPTSSLVELLSDVSVIGLREVRSSQLELRLAALAEAGQHAACDAVSEEDIARIGAALAHPLLRNRVLPVGSCGLARSWAAEVSCRRGSVRRPVLAAVSSVKPVSLRQAEIAGVRGAHITLGAAETDLDGARTALRRGRDAVLVAAEAGRPPVAQKYEAAAGLARRMERLARAEPIGGLVIVGGDLASTFLNAANASAEVIAAPWAATALVSLVGGPLDGLPAILKSGSQGSPEWLDEAFGLIRCIRQLREEAHVG